MSSPFRLHAPLQELISPVFSPTRGPVSRSRKQLLAALVVLSRSRKQTLWQRPVTSPPPPLQHPHPLTEPAIGGFFVTGATCTDANAAITGNPASFGALASTVLIVPATNIRAGADITCTFTNTKGAPSLQLLKTANTAGPLIEGQTVTYTYQITNNGNVPVTGITVADVHNGSGTFTGPNSEALVTDNAPAGDTTDAGINASWDVLGPGDVIRFSATYVVTLNDIETLQ
jgi:uncharacterized repeat protein (TIGR01451 family)